MAASTSPFRKRIAIPQEHGSWMFLLLPLLVGMRAGGAFPVASWYLIVAALAGFLMRQPILALTKIRAGRRPASDRPAAWFWIVVYGTIAGLHIGGLVYRGFGFVLHLAVPALPVAAWHAWLVMHRAERRQELMEILAAGALALSAPAAMWIGSGVYDPDGWLLWLLTWQASAAMIVHTYLRLDQRTWPEVPPLPERLRAGRRSLAVSGTGLLTVVAFASAGLASWALLAPFAILVIEARLGALLPAVGQRPRRIGFRQLAVSIAVTAAFLLVV